MVASALLSVTLIFVGIPITAWLLGHHVVASWRSRAFAAEYVLSLGMGAVIVTVLAGLYTGGYGFVGSTGAAAYGRVSIKAPGLRWR